MSSLHALLVAWYACASVLSFWLYTRDKAAAAARRDRTSEATLLLVDLFGGWPGGFTAQRLKRHKTAKTSFQRRFALSVAANLVVLWLTLRA